MKLYYEFKYILWRIYAILIKKFTIEIHLADHCNLNCKACNHYSPIAPISFPDMILLKNSLKNLSKIKSSIGSIRLLGGEPLLNKDITKIIKLVRSYFPSLKLEVFTNGILLPKIEMDIPEFWEICKLNNVGIVITKYPINLDYNKVKELCLSKKVNAKIFSDRSIGKTFFKCQLNPKGRESKLNYYQCMNNSCLQLKNNKIYSCSTAAYINFLNNKFSQKFKLKDNDFIEINSQISSLKLRKFLIKTKPFCKYCIFPREKISWSISKLELNEWV